MSIREVDPDKWLVFAKTTPQYSIFVNPAWMNLIGNHVIKGCYDGDNLIGGIPIQHMGAWWFSGGPHVPYTQYQGLCVKAEGSTAHINSLNLQVSTELEASLGDVVTEVYNHPSWTDIRAFKETGWRPDIRYTMVVHAEGAWQGFEKQMRYRIKKNPVTNTESDIGKFYQMYHDGMTAKDISVPKGEDFLFGLDKSFKCHCLTEAKRGVFVVEDGGIMYFLIGVGDDTASLLWCLMEGMESEQLDLLGCNNLGIARYKTGFGGQLVPYFGATR